MTKITIKSDGGSRGNPGPAAIGYVVFVGDKIIAEHGECIGDATNNTAEYKGILMALSWLENNIKSITKEYPTFSVECLLDSKLVVNQLMGNFKIKQAHLQILANQTFQVIRKLKQPVSFRHIKREFNTEPDLLLNIALDNQI